MNVFGCNKKLANVDPPKRPLEDKLQNLKEIIKFNDDKVIWKLRSNPESVFANLDSS